MAIQIQKEKVEEFTKQLKKKKKVRLTGIGTFMLRDFSPGRRRNPRTKKLMQTKSRKRVKFSPAKKLKQNL